VASIGPRTRFEWTERAALYCPFNTPQPLLIPLPLDANTLLPSTQTFAPTPPCSTSTLPPSPLFFYPLPLPLLSSPPHSRLPFYLHSPNLPSHSPLTPSSSFLENSGIAFNQRIERAGQHAVVRLVPAIRKGVDMVRGWLTHALPRLSRFEAGHHGNEHVLLVAAGISVLRSSATDRRQH